MTETLTVRRPAAPVPRKNPVSFLRVLWELRQNPIAAFGEGAYRLPLIHLKSRIRDFLLVNEPESIKHVLLDNVANYIKSDQVQRLTRPALGNGLLNAEGASWRFQRRTAAPMFQMRHVASFGPVMAAATADMLARWDALPDGTMIDAADEMMRLTYDIICRTVFSGDVTMDYGRMSKAILVYLETLGRIDMLGLLGLPRWVPTPDRVRAAPALRYFRREMEGLIERRKALIARDADSAPNDLLTLLLTAHDPEGGTLFSDREVFDNVMTFVFAGHETTANALAWTLYLLSQFPDADAQVAGEVRGVDEARIASGDLPELPFTRAVLEELHAALSARAVRQPGSRRGGHGRRHRDPSPNIGPDLDLDSAPASFAVGAAGRVRSRPLPARTERTHPPLRLSAVRRRSAHLHRHGLCDAGGDGSSGRDHAPLQVGA